ncbi:hypothetical protein ASPFODRAFT_205918 [Aspergillus luchuensis CBS 106.47]|uniref:Uncharacterized protein n=1 Tax=Aspergillus luchuensis (strain CBS 106.47) TaxID=1137211 RepID=A0A1M3TQI2_ASPLC|nr:hypothetical protein ASPFODRAFT_205918 [Aspergillus luchuensis CBS 106.47]
MSLTRKATHLDFMPTRLVAAMERPLVFLHIPKDDPTVAQYLLCIPNEDVQADGQADGELRLHWTAIGQVLAFTFQALAVEPPTQKCGSNISSTEGSGSEQ